MALSSNTQSTISNGSTLTQTRDHNYNLRCSSREQNFKKYKMQSYQKQTGFPVLAQFKKTRLPEITPITSGSDQSTASPVVLKPFLPDDDLREKLSQCLGNESRDKELFDIVTNMQQHIKI